MDPVTTIGITLGVIPLFISVIESYEKILQPFAVYRRYEKEINRFTSRLDTQKAVLYNECQIILSSVTSSQDLVLSKILVDPSHSFRSDPELNQKLRQLLGSSYEACVSILKRINATLEKVTLETKGFKELLQKKPSSKCSLYIFRQKIKISFSKSQLDKVIDDLRLDNEQLARLSRQIQDLERQRASQTIGPSQTLKKGKILNLTITQQASKQLYKILADKWSCEEGIEHTANISLEPEGSDYERIIIDKVCFNLVLTCKSHSISEESVPLWLKIESETREAFYLETPNEADELIVALENISEKGNKKDAKISFLSNTQASNSLSAPKNAEQHTTQQPGMDFNLSAATRLCRHLHANMLPQTTIHESCIGYLEDTGPFKHFIYPLIKPRQSNSTSKTVSLQQILQNLASQGKREAWTEKFRLARLLTIAVLNFWSTPWLKETWSSNDVHFLSLPEEFDLRSPCLIATLPTDAGTPVARSQASIEHTASAIATNAMLFNLGVALLELGYDAPFQSLRRPQDVEKSAGSPYADFFTAKRLGERVHRELNSAYGRIVKRCLICDFGAGDNLDSVELQSAVVIHVVRELERCLKEEQDFERMF